MDEFLTVNEFAAKLGLSRRVVMGFVAEGMPVISTTPGQRRTKYVVPVERATDWLVERSAKNGEIKG